MANLTRKQRKQAPVLASREPNRAGTYTPYKPYDTQPLSTNYEYSGPVPVGPLPHAWEGVQKVNAVAYVGRFWARYGYLNLSAQLETAQFAQLSNPMARYVGPGIVTGPIEQQASQAGQAQQAQQSLGRRLLSRISGNG